MDGLTVGGLLLVAGPLGAILVSAHPSLYPVWSASRERHLAIVGAHRWAWNGINAGFFIATTTTAGGLAALTASLAGDAVRTAVLAALTLGYAMSGVLWCTLVAIRAHTTPELADIVDAAGTPSAPDAAERLLGAALSGVFVAFSLSTSVILIGLGLTLAVAGGVAPWVGIVAAVVALVALVAQIATGDSIPAVLYLPTILIGVALLLGWA